MGRRPKLDPPQILDLIALYKSGTKSQSELAGMYGISIRAVQRYLARHQARKYNKMPMGKLREVVRIAARAGTDDGYKVITSKLRATGAIPQNTGRRRILRALREVDPEGVDRRRKRRADGDAYVMGVDRSTSSPRYGEAKSGLISGVVGESKSTPGAGGAPPVLVIPPPLPSMSLAGPDAACGIIRGAAADGGSVELEEARGGGGAFVLVARPLLPSRVVGEEPPAAGDGMGLMRFAGPG